MTVHNLDAACARLGATLAAAGNKDTENSITKALGVLEEQGLYAMFLYLHAREKDWGKKTSKELANFLREQPGQQNPLLPADTNNDLFEEIGQLARDLDKLLFARDLLHRSLVYARYHAKAAQKSIGERA